MANKLHEELGFDPVAFMATPASTSYNQGQVTWLYLMGCGETFFKVGIASNVEKRRIAIQACCPAPIRVERTVYYESKLYALLAEKTAHGLLKPYHLHGEWFRCERGKIGKVISLVKLEMPKLIRKHQQEWRDRENAWRHRYETDPEFRRAADKEGLEIKANWEYRRAVALGEASPLNLEEQPQ